MSIKVNREILEAFKPCEGRWENYLKHYSAFDGTFEELCDLPDLSYSDKIWCMQKLFNKNQAVHFAIMCAEMSLPNFEKAFPDDKRPRECIEYLKSIPDFSNLTLEEISRIKFQESAARSAGLSAGSAAESAESAMSARLAAGSGESAAESAARSARLAAGSGESAAAVAESAAESARLAGSSARSAGSEIIEFLKTASRL